MYRTSFVTSLTSDEPIDKAAHSGLGEAVHSARLRIKATSLAHSGDPTDPHPIGFVIYDEAGRCVHREYPGLF
jgi:hypothetical protein